MVELLFYEQQKGTGDRRKVVRTVPVSIGDLALFNFCRGGRGILSEPYFGIIESVGTHFDREENERSNDGLFITSPYLRLRSGQKVLGVEVPLFVTPRGYTVQSFRTTYIHNLFTGSAEEIARSLREHFSGFELHAGIIEQMKRPYFHTPYDIYFTK